MARIPSLKLTLTVALCVAAASATVGLQVAGASSSGREALPGTGATAKARAHRVGSVAKSSPVSFDLVLRLRHATSAKALLRAVSTPGSARYRHYLTRSQWERRFSPTNAQVSRARRWLRSQGFKVQTVSKDRLTIAASGTANQVERAFGTRLGLYRVAGHTVRLANGNLSVPTSLAGTVQGALGVNEYVARAAGVNYPPPPPAFITHPPCGAYYAAKSTTVSPPYGHGYPTTIPDQVCGYKPGQFRSAYSIPSADTGKGYTVGIVDAYNSATIASDASQYFATNDPGNSFANAHFKQINHAPFNYQALCGSWATEQAIDVEAVHSTAKNAHIVYVGAKNCLDSGLFAADQTIVDGGLANVITNSWGDVAGDVLTDSSTRAAFDNLFLMAGSTGITMLYSSGDWDDNFPLTGISAPTYPASSPYVTGVGGTTLKIGSKGQRIGELGWNTGRSFFCSSNAVGVLCTKKQLGTWLPAAFDGTSGGYTSYNYGEPYYQKPVVPSDLADRNSAVSGEANRVVPDISLDADPSTGFLIGLTEKFPDGTVHYGQTRYGGTSLASPLLAGVIADADQAGGVPVGFINPSIYRMDVKQPSSIMDILPEVGKQANYREDYADMIVGGAKGVFRQFRELYWPGPEVYCDGTGNCVSRPQTLTVTKGYDSLTGLGSPGTNFISVLGSG